MAGRRLTLAIGTEDSSFFCLGVESPITHKKRQLAETTVKERSWRSRVGRQARRSSPSRGDRGDAGRARIRQSGAFFF